MLNFDNICRLCMDNKNVSLTLKTLDSDKKQLLQKLIVVTPEIFEQDEEKNEHKFFPQNICTTCHSQLIQAYTFKKKCLETHELLLRHYKQQQNVSEQSKNENTIQEFVDIKTPNFSIKDENICNKINEDLITNNENETLSTPLQSDNSNSSFYVPEEYVEPVITENNETNETKDFLQLNLDEENQSDVKSKNTEEDDDNSKRNRKNKSRKLSSNFKAVSNPENPTEFTVTHPRNPNSKITYIKDPDKNKFYCKSCDKKYKSLYVLTRHIERHFWEKKYQCDYCDYKSYKKVDIIRHTSVSHPSKPKIDKNKLKLKKLETKNKSGFNKIKTQNWGILLHPDNPIEYVLANPKNPEIKYIYIKDNENNVFYCKNCNKYFNSYDVLRQHLYQHYGDKRYKCDFCEYKSFHSSTVKAHIARHHPKESGFQEQNFKCDLCDRSYNSTSRLREHVLRHQKNFICEICARTFASAQDLGKHKLVHSDEKNFVCSICGYRGKSQNHLNQHVRNRHEDANLRQVKCTICHKLYASKSSLFTHMKSHDKNNVRHICTVCNRTFYFKSHFNQHMKQHTGEKNFKCEHCDKAFALISQYKCHVRTHTGEKPFDCKFCGKSFGVRASLQRHTLIHTGERPFKCEHCGKTFIQSVQLKTHLKVHRDKITDTS